MITVYFMSLLVIVYLVTVIFTALLRRYAVNRELFDIPGERSSHTRITPKGGGLAIVVSFFGGISALTVSGVLPLNVFLALMGGFIVALVGWVDDSRDVTVPVRLLAHFAAAGWAFYWAGGIYAFGIEKAGPVKGAFFVLAALSALVWLINLYNFMDGIDGIAAAETVFAALAAGILLFSGSGAPLAWPLWILAAATAGFLLWNWPPARIFMGDVSSGFLGFVLGVFIMAGAREGIMPVWPWLIILGVFLTDSMVTLLRRVVRGSRWYEAHCRHAYQHAARRWGHLRTVLGVTAVNIFWLAPMSFIAWRFREWGAVTALLALVPLVYAAYRFKAGEEPVRGTLKERDHEYISQI